MNSLLENKPTTMDELKNIPGFGPKKIEHFGEDVLKVIKWQVE